MRIESLKIKLAFIWRFGMISLSSFTLPDAGDEDSFVDSVKRTCFNTFYPFLIFPKWNWKNSNLSR